MLVLTVPSDPDQLGRNNCLVLDLPEGKRIRLWLTDSTDKGVRLVIDAPRSVFIRRGRVVGAEAEESPPSETN